MPQKKKVTIGRERELLSLWTTLPLEPRPKQQHTAAEHLSGVYNVVDLQDTPNSLGCERD